jgi:hypothetical protein
VIRGRNMMREIIRPSSSTYSIHIPEEYINQEVEILILPFSHRNEHDTSNQDIKALLASVSEGLEEEDLKRQDKVGREIPNWLS